MEWTRTAISESTRAWLAALPQRRVESDFTLVHGSPRDPTWEYVTSAALARAGLSAHLDRARAPRPHPRPDRVHRGRRPDAHARPAGRQHASPSARAGRCLNPGSVGQPRDGDPRASYLILDLDGEDRDLGPGRLRRRGRGVPLMRAAGLPATARRPVASLAPEATAVIGGRRPLQGRKPGDRRVRVERPHAPYFRYTGKGQLTAKEAASAPTSATGRAFASIRALFFGRPLASEEELGERLSQDEGARDLQLRRDQLVGLRDRGDPPRPDPRRRRRAGLRASRSASRSRSCWSRWRSRYRQICIAYPTGGGSYTVSRRNIGRTVSLVAASALLIDYVMTVAVSTSSAVEQIVSAFPVLYDERVLIGVVAIGLITIANLRGLREAGQHLRGPDLPVHRLGAAHDRRRGVPDRRPRRGRRRTARRSPQQPTDTAQPLGDPAAATRLRGRRRGPDRHRGDRHRRAGVQAARGEERGDDPRGDGRPARRPVHRDHVPGGQLRDPPDRVPGEEDGHRPGRPDRVRRRRRSFYLFQAFTALLLFLAANTSFNAFPRLLAILAGDGHMPRQFALRGDRLAFSYGIIVLGARGRRPDRHLRRLRPTS